MEKQKTIMVITHDPEFILDCCNYIVEVKNGFINESYFLKDNEHRLLNYFIKGGIEVEKEKTVT